MQYSTLFQTFYFYISKPIVNPLFTLTQKANLNLWKKNQKSALKPQKFTLNYKIYTPTQKPYKNLRIKITQKLFIFSEIQQTHNLPFTQLYQIQKKIN
jgi:hypothetical protein